MKKTNTPVSDFFDYLARKIFILEYVEDEQGKSKTKSEDSSAWVTVSNYTVEKSTDKSESGNNQPVAF